MQSTLNNIFKQAVTSWEVSVASPLNNITFANGKYIHGETSAISTYNTDQKAIAKEFENQYGKPDKNTYYLFYLKSDDINPTNVIGYMPLKRQVGFIYGTPSQTTVAHELAHGAFNLYHTFSSENNIATQGSTKNLMDYNDGQELWKYQWDLIHDPQTMLFAWGQDEEEGEMSEIGKGKVFVFDDIYSKCKKKSFTFEGTEYKVPFPFDKNISDNINSEEASYIYLDFDLSKMEKLRASMRQLYPQITDPILIDEFIKEDENHIQGTEVPSYTLNSPMTVNAINQDDLNISDFYYTDIINRFDTWGNANWDFTGLLDNKKTNRQSFALESLKQGSLDISSFYNLDANTVYLIDYEQNEGRFKAKVLYNSKEIRYWCYGYYLAKMQFTPKQAIGVTMQFFDKLEVKTFDVNKQLQYLPWSIDAMLDGYYTYGDRNINNNTPYINMYKPYEPINSPEYEFDIMWDLGELTLDMMLITTTGGTYSVGKTIIQIGNKVTIGAAIDITLQIALAKLDGTSTEDAYKQIVWSDVIYSGVETLHSSWVSQSAMACMSTAFDEMGGDYDYNTVISDCGVTFVTNFLTRKLLGSNDRFSNLLRKCLGKNASETINGLWVLGLDKSTVEWIVSHVMGEAFKKDINPIINNQFKDGKKE